MNIDNISNYKNGLGNVWLCGHFDNSIIQTSNFEIGIHWHDVGIAEPHKHKYTTEWNIILEGRLIANGKELERGAIFIYSPDEVNDVVFLEKCQLIVIRNGSYKNDKVINENNNQNI